MTCKFKVLKLILDWREVWTLTWPLQDINTVGLKPILCSLWRNVWDRCLTGNKSPKSQFCVRLQQASQCGWWVSGNVQCLAYTSSISSVYRAYFTFVSDSPTSSGKLAKKIIIIISICFQCSFCLQCVDFVRKLSAVGSSRYSNLHLNWATL